MSSVMNFPIHDYPFDYWRFTPEAFRSLLKPFTPSFVGLVGDDNFPHTVVGIGFMGPIPENALEEFVRRFNRWKKQYQNDPLGTGRKLGSGWKGVV